ncbi:MAG: gluconate 2-dehydrogenase subunit 3 family protein [Proteobacteria bacterium]|nr:gluconate 2-dehydrogenase subunit 3 family protein [Pseudomonadota bacterium]
MPDRRETLSWLLRALALSAAPIAGTERAGARILRPGAGGAPGAEGYGRDPSLLHPHIPWPSILTPPQKGAVARLADVFLPEHGASPAASALGVPDFVDEWVSAPYPQQQRDRIVVLQGLTDLERDAGAPIGELDARQAEDLVARLHARAAAGAAPEGRFFRRFRQICLIGYYTTPAGVAQLGYVGYQPSARFAGPPPQVLAKLGIEPGG